MSSSATPPQETPIWESSIFKEAQLRARTEQAAREAAAVARYKSASNRAPVKVEIDLSSEAGAWKLEHRPYGFVLSRGPGELLIVSNSSERPGEWSVIYDEPIEFDAVIDDLRGPE